MNRHPALLVLMVLAGSTALGEPPERCDLLGAVERGELREVRALLDRGCDVNAKAEVTGSALHEAARNGDVRMAKLLLDRGANVHQRDDEGDTPLHAAVAVRLRSDASRCRGRQPSRDDDTCWVGQTEMIRLLLARGADPNVKNAFGQTALHVAITNRLADNVRLLLRSGRAGLSVPDGNGDTPLYLAASEGSLPLVQALLSHGADPDSRGGEGWTALHVTSNVATAKVLLKHGAKIGARNDDGATPLHLQAGHSDQVCEPGSKVATLLARSGAPVHARDDLGRTPLHFATWEGNVELVTLLLSRGAKANARDDDGLTPLHWFAVLARPCLPLRDEFRRTLKALLDAGAGLDEEDRAGRTPLEVAIARGQTHVTALLLELGASVAHRGPRGATPLHFAAHGDSAWLVERLLERGASVDAPDADGRTPLHWAAAIGRTHAASRLLARGASVEAADASGRTPLDWAELACEDEARRLLLERGAPRRVAADAAERCPAASAVSKVDERMEKAARAPQANVIADLVRDEIALDVRDSRGRTPLHIVASHFFLRSELDLLLARKADPNARDSDGRTPLHAAAADARLEVAEKLVTAGADVNAADRRGRTPLHLVPYLNDQARLTRFLVERGADLSARDRLGRTPLHAAASQTMWYRAWAEFLVCRGADPDVRDHFGWSTSDVATFSGWPDRDPVRCTDEAKGYGEPPTSQAK